MGICLKMSLRHTSRLCCLILCLFVIANQFISAVAKPQQQAEQSPITEAVVEVVATAIKDERVDESLNESVSENEQSNIADFSASMAYRENYAKEIITFMNQTVDPCDDFYEYACGNWGNVIAERQAPHKRNYLLDITYTLVDTMEQLLEQTPPETEDFNHTAEWKLARKFYTSCLATDLYPLNITQDYLDVIREMGGFPVVDGETWRVDNFSWFHMSSQLAVYGISSLIREKIIPEYPYPPYFLLPELGFDYIVHSDNIADNSSRGYVLNEQRMRGYLESLGVEATRTDKTISDIFDFWRDVLQVMDEFNEDKGECENIASEPFEQWDEYFAITWNGIDFDVTEDDCPCDYFYKKLNEICNEHKEAVANYLSLKFLFAMDARLKDAKFQKDFCLMNLRSAMPYLIDQLYLAEYFNEEIKADIANIIQEIRKSLRVVLTEATWLDEATRKEALLKESTIVSRIGSFEDPLLVRRLIDEMKNLTFVSGNYARNNINLKKFRAFLKRYLGLHHDQINSDTKPLELLVGMQVNAFYYNIDNSINVMAGILHPPAFHKYWPNALKFGTIGYLIGHEFTHGFDSVGATFDSTGNSRSWWTEKAKTVFDERSACYVDHYNQYKIASINRFIDGNQTLDENLADSGGLREALMAYRRYMKEIYKETNNLKFVRDEQMPGLDLSPEQLFFLGFAQLWCAAYEEEHYWEELRDEHTIDKYRVLGAVTNIDDFAKVYNCPLGSKMNPSAEKCRLW